MAIRIFEYGYAHALQNKETKDGVIILPYPRNSRVLTANEREY
jgi:hypothetical protein